MKKIFNYKKIVGIITITTGVVAAACILVGAIAVDYNFDAFSDPTLLLQYAHNSKAAYWFLLLDMAGYYLLLLPVIFYLHKQYKYQSPWVPLLTFSGLGYVLVGAIGAAILAATWPQLMQYSLTPGADQQTVSLVFNTLTLIVTKGLWNILEVFFAALWWIGFGILFRRDHKTIGLLSIIAGIACLLDSVGTIAGWNMMAEIGVNIYLLMGIIWPVVLGIYTIRKPGTKSFSGNAANTSIINKPEIYVEA